MQNQINLLNEKVVLEKNLSKSIMASIKAQMNPHFFYNALNTIQAYIFTMLSALFIGMAVEEHEHEHAH